MNITQPMPPPATRGMTLIELLIVIAILAISSGGIVHVTTTVHRAQLRQRDWAQGLEAAQDAIEALRAQDTLPADGTHPFPPEVAEAIPAGATGQIDITPGPTPSVRRVSVTVKLDSEGQGKDIKLVALMPPESTGAQEVAR